MYVGKSAVHLAAEKNHRDIVDLLISTGSVMDQEIQNGNYWYVLSKSISYEA